MSFIFRGPQSANTRVFTAIAALVSGAAVQMPDNRVGVVVPSEIPVGETGGVYVEGRFDAPIADGVAIAAGDTVHVDIATGRITNSPASGNVRAGVALTGGTGDAAGSVYAEIDLNIVPGVVES